MNSPLLAHGNRVRYLRLSLTPSCAMRCLYCRPDLDARQHRPGLMNARELESVVRHLVARHGVRKVRLTGGDPSSRPDLLEIIERIGRIDGVDDLAMTTHGLALATQARAWKQAGLRRVNVSLDSLDPERFARITGVRGLARVIAGIDAARDAGLGPIKLNTVVLRDENLAELPDLLAFAHGRGLAIRFIELMPMGPLADRWRDRFVSADEMRARLSDVVEDWFPQPRGPESADRRRAVLRGGGEADVGFITPMSCNFCHACDRLRVTAEGGIYPCLMDQPRGSVLPALRPRFDATALDALLARALGKKAPEHPAEGFGIMTHIGG